MRTMCDTRVLAFTDIKEPDFLAVVHPFPRVEIEAYLGRELPEEEYQNMMYQIVPADCCNVREMESSVLPEDMTFRNAWRDVSNDECIDICMRTSKEIALCNIRRARDAELLENDRKFLIAQRNGEGTEELAAERQRLLDITEEVKALTHSDTHVLDGHPDLTALKCKMEECIKLNN